MSEPHGLPRGALAGRAAMVAIALLLCGPTIGAQIPTARLSGTVRDATNASIAGADVEGLELGSGRTWRVTTGETGVYSFAALPPGSYRLTVRSDGFKTFVADALPVTSTEAVRFDVTLEIGPRSEVVDVRADTRSLQIDSTQVSTTFDSRDVVSLPANGHNFMSLALLSPGVVISGPAGLASGRRTSGGGRFSVNGNRREANNFQLDGIDANQTTENIVSLQPSLDAIEAVNLVTNTAPAEVGNYQGGIVNVTIKSGTNRLHGSALESYRDERLNASPWECGWQPVDPFNRDCKPPLSHHLYGGTAGGPILTNRVFFFADYQGTRRREGKSVALLTFLPEAIRRGDFSSLLDGSTPQQLFDPLTTRPDPSRPGQYLREPFPGNRIPASRIDAVAAALFASGLYPLPSLPSPTLNTFNTRGNRLSNHQADVKIDAKPGPGSDVSARYSQGLQKTAATNSQAILLAGGTVSPLRAGAFQWAAQVGRSVVNEARVGFNRIVLLDESAQDLGGIGNLGEAFGIPGSNRLGPGLPALGFSGAATGVGGAKVVNDFTSTTWQIQDALTWQHGNHLLKSGVLVLRYLQDVYFSGNTGQLGTFEFTGQYTRDLSDPRSIGSAVADFMLGFPSRITRGDFADKWGHRTTLWAGFVQDDWRASRQLTANLGLRYEYRTPLVEVQDRQVNFDLATGAPVFAGKNGNGRGLYRGFKSDWQPRVGLAWTPLNRSDRLVVRGAYGISSYQEGTGTNLRLTLNPPFFNELEAFNDPVLPALTISSGFDALREKDPLVGTILRVWDPNLRPVRSQQWSVMVEPRLGRDVTASVGYVGQFATHLVVPVNANQAPRPGEPRPFDSVYPQISSVILTAANANQRYNGLQMTARKRFSDGWEVFGAYTWSTAWSHGRGFFSDGGQVAEAASFWPNPRDRDAEWAPASFDVRHNLAVAGLAEMPWGNGRRWLSGGPGWLKSLVGGWSVAGIWKAHTGFPITITAPDQSQTRARSGRPDCTGDVEGPRQVGQDSLWFNTAAFTLPNAGTFGNCGVGVVRGPGFNVVDLSLVRTLGYGGLPAIEIRADAFNVFNKPVFNAPDRSITSSTFGNVGSAQLSRELQLSAKLRF